MTGWTQDPTTWPAEDDRRHQHWLIEKRLAAELMASKPAEREDVTRDVYNRLFDEIPWHDANVASAQAQDSYEEHWFQLYGPLTRSTDVMLDIGCGRGGLVKRFSRAVKEGIGLDASDAMVQLASENSPANIRFIVGNLLTPPLPAGSVDFVVSRQLMEHLHPDDVPSHLKAVHDLLRPGGRFLIETPSRITGPWDISRGFSEISTGFHLREYTNGEMGALLREAGFARVRGPGVPATVLERLPYDRRGRTYVSVGVKEKLERVLRRLPAGRREKLAGPLLVRDVTLVAEKH